jgi:hypothetical protein
MVILYVSGESLLNMNAKLNHYNCSRQKETKSKMKRMLLWNSGASNKVA